jgi:single-strand DNA-binding protein
MINCAVIMGRLVADPELKTTPAGVEVCKITVAVDRNFVKAGEERQCDFIDVVAWRTTAVFVCKYFHKGSMIAVNGEIQTRTYEDKSGNKRKAFEIVARNVSFCGGKSEGNNSAPSSVPAAPFDSVEDDEDLPF